MQQKQRYHSLDSLRGLACLQVVIGHCLVALPALAWLVYPETDKPVHDLKFYLAYSPIHFFWSATPAVIVFFVLSGLVLSLPYYSDNSNTPVYFKYFIKRILRLYLPCLAIILLSVLFKHLLYNPAGVTGFSTWINNIWSNPETIPEWTNRLLLNGAVINIDPALWTLPIEIKLSLILPFFIYLLNKLPFLWDCAGAIMFTVVFYTLSKLGLKYAVPEYNNLFYFTFFLWGTLVCKYRHQISNWVNRLSNAAFTLLIVLSIFIYTFNYSMWWLPHRLMDFLERFHEYVSGIAAILFILIVLSSRAHNLFNSRLLKYIGKISFSLYLVHPVVLVSMAYLLHNYFNAYIIVSGAFLMSMLVSVVFYQCVEIPSLNLAQRVAAMAISKKSKKNS